MGAYMVGVDHAVVDKKPMILEINGSPGMESTFGLYALSKDDNSYKGKTTRNAIISSIVDYLEVDIHRNPMYTTECGYIESIDLEDIGVFRAKMDTGNGTHGSRLEIDEMKIDKKAMKVVWKHEGKTFTHKIEDFSYPEHQVELGERPIIHVNLTFNNRYYTNVPIALTTDPARSDMLINRSLLQLFHVNVNPGKKFLLSDHVERRQKEAKK
jgi:hypothetical protein